MVYGGAQLEGARTPPSRLPVCRSPAVELGAAAPVNDAPTAYARRVVVPDPRLHGVPGRHLAWRVWAACRLGWGAHDSRARRGAMPNAEYGHSCRISLTSGIILFQDRLRLHRRAAGEGCARAAVVVGSPHGQPQTQNHMAYCMMRTFRSISSVKCGLLCRAGGGRRPANATVVL